jgi:excisionase family DNA binding protein
MTSPKQWPSDQGASRREADLRLHEPGESQPPPPQPTAPSPIPGPHVRSRELAQMLNVSLRTLMRWREQGKLPKPLPGYGQLRWRRSEITRWFACGMPTREVWESINPETRRS